MKSYSPALLLILASGVDAQVVTDGTVGPAQQIAGPNFRIGAEIGLRAGGNLFFSFREFSLPTGTTATFSGPADIREVISRITGGRPSFIDGMLRVEGMPQANLWFINPAGVTFGPNASLDVPASVYISTADSLHLGNDGRFDATQPAGSVLTSSPPAAFGFLDASVGALTVNGATLTVRTGQEISLVGGDIALDAGRLVAPGGRVQLASVASAGTVLRDGAGTLRTSGIGALGNVHLRRSEAQFLNLQGNIDVSSPATGVVSGRVDLLGAHLVSDSGGVFAVNRGAAAGGDINLQFAESIDLRGFTDVRTEALRGGAGGDITIGTRQFVARGETQIVSDTASSGRGGDVRIDAASIGLRDTAAISSNTAGAGAGGNVSLAATGDISMSGISTIRVRTDAGGDAGNIALVGENIRLTQSATLQASTFSRSTGDGGTIQIRARDTFEFTGTGSGEPGDSALISTAADGSGDAGDIEIEAQEIVIGGLALIQTSASAGGDAGDIVLDAGAISLTGGSAIDSRTLGTGRGGSIRVSADSMSLAEGSRLSAESLGAGDAGDILVTTTGNLALSSSRIATAARTADGGNIQLSVGGDLFLADSAIETSVQSGSGSGGNIALAAPELVVLRNSRIVADAFGGDGGNIDAVGDFFIFSSTSAVTASSALGVDGVIRFSSPEVDLGALSEAAVAQRLDAEGVQLSRCDRQRSDASRLVVNSQAMQREGISDCQ